MLKTLKLETLLEAEELYQMTEDDGLKLDVEHAEVIELSTHELDILELGEQLKEREE